MKAKRQQHPRESIPAPHTGQERFFALPGRHRIAVCGRRFGKDVIGALCATDDARHGGKVLWIEPTDDQAKDAAAQLWEYLEKNLRTKAQPKGEWRYAATTKEFHHIATRGKIRFRSALVGHALRGRGWTLVLLNEAANINAKVWRTDIAPSLLTTKGRALILGTPKGKANWLWAQFEAAAHKTNWSRFHAPTRLNPLVKLSELNAFRQEMTEHEFREEFEAEFIDLAEAVFPNIEEHISGEPANDGIQGRWHATGIDVGQAKFCVCISIDTQTNKARGITRWHEKPWAVSEATIRKHIKRFRGPATIDSTGIGSGLAEEIDDIAQGFIFTEEWRTRILKDLAAAWEADRLKICNDPQLCHELRCMVWAQEGTAPHVHLVPRTTGALTDCVMALALAWYTRCRKGDAPAPRQQKQWMSFA